MGARERYVPQRVGQLTTRLVSLGGDGDTAAGRFRSFARLVSALYHFEFHDREQAVLQAWERATGGGEPGAVAAVAGELRPLLERAEYVRITMDELHEALERESLIRLRLHVDLDEYDEVLLYRRGSRTETVDVPRWRGLRTETRTITVESRVVVLTQVRGRAWFDERGVDPAERGLVPGQLSLKEFQDVPRADIEMLLPSTQVKLRRIDSLVVGVPAVVSGVVVLTTKLLPTLGLVLVLLGAWAGIRDETPRLDQGALVALLGGLAAVGGFVARQWTKLKNRRVNYLKTLSETLYFRTLADGPGVVHMLLDAAEQQEVAEVLLAYRFLLAAPDGLDAGALDDAVERWLDDTGATDVDFDVEGALGKLRDLDLLGDSPHLVARPLPDALARLDRRWDDLFRFDDATVPTTSG